MVYATFATLDLDALATMIFDAGWDYVAGTTYQKGGKRAILIMGAAGYSLAEG